MFCVYLMVSISGVSRNILHLICRCPSIHKESARMRTARDDRSRAESKAAIIQASDGFCFLVHNNTTTPATKSSTGIPAVRGVPPGGRVVMLSFGRRAAGRCKAQVEPTRGGMLSYDALGACGTTSRTRTVDVPPPQAVVLLPIRILFFPFPFLG